MKAEVEIEEEEAALGRGWSGSSRNARDNEEGHLVREDNDEDTLASEDISVRPLFRGFEHLTNIQNPIQLRNFDTFSCLCRILFVCFENLCTTVKLAQSD